MTTGLHGDRGQLRQQPAATVGRGGDVADGPHARTTRNAQPRVDGDAPAALLVELEDVGQWVGTHAGRPHEGLGGDDLATGQGHRLRVHRLDLVSEAHVDVALGERLEGVAAAAGVERRQQMRQKLDQHDPSSADGQAGVVLGEDHVEQLGERARGLHSCRAAADDDDGERAVVDQLRVGVGRLEAVEDVVPQADGVGERVERVAVLGRAGHAEPVDGGPAGDDELVERQRILAVEPQGRGASQSTPVTSPCRKRTFGCRRSSPRTA